MFILLHSQETLYEEIEKFMIFLNKYIVTLDSVELSKRNICNFIPISSRFSGNFSDYKQMYIPRKDQELIENLKTFCTDNNYKNIFNIVTVDNDFDKYDTIYSIVSSKKILTRPPEKIVKKTVILSLKNYDAQLKRERFNEEMILNNILGNTVTIKFPNKTIQLPKNLACRSKYLKSRIDNFNIFSIEIIQNYSDEDIEKLVKNLLRKTDENLDIIKFFMLD